MTVTHKKLSTVEPRGRSLSVVIDVWIGFAFIIAMILCAGVEYLRNPDVSVGELLSHHLLELLLFGSVLWGISWLVIRSVLVEPIGQIYQHLYLIGGGDHSPLSITTGVLEIQEMVDAINIMLWKMDQNVDRKAVVYAREKVANIREHITGCDGIDHEKLTAILDQVSELERKLHQVGLTETIRQDKKGSKYWGLPDMN